MPPPRGFEFNEFPILRYRTAHKNSFGPTEILIHVSASWLTQPSQLADHAGSWATFARRK